MKLAFFTLTLSTLVLGCENTALKNLREMYTAQEIQQFLTGRAITETMLKQAIYHDDLEIYTLFFTYGKLDGMDYNSARLSQTNGQGAEPIYFLPLHLAAQVGATKITSFCLRNDADLNRTTVSKLAPFNENTPAHIAVSYGKYEVLKMLTAHKGFNLSSKNGVGKTIKDIAHDKGDQIALNIIKDL
jgi:ankyrin repeat protein